MDLKELVAKVKHIQKPHPSYWGNALAGETGELCNLIKKLERDNRFIQAEFEDEVADVFIYLAIITKVFQIGLERAILAKLAVLEGRRSVD